MISASCAEVFLAVDGGLFSVERGRATIASPEVFEGADADVLARRITDTEVNTWIVLAAIILAAFVATRRLAVRPTKLQGLLESMYAAIEGTIREILPVEPRFVVPVLGTL